MMQNNLMQDLAEFLVFLHGLPQPRVMADTDVLQKALSQFLLREDFK